MTAITKWAETFLENNEYIISAQPEFIQQTPYSSVARILTNKGMIYLKQTPPDLFLEPVITQILYEKFHANVPLIIGINKTLHCILVKDVGNPLRDFFKDHFQPDLLSQAFKEYAHIQRAVEGHISMFLQLGVPDWRLDKLPLLYQELIGKEDLLMLGMSDIEVKKLQDLYPDFVSVCELLSRQEIRETLDHCDFHDNNIMIENTTHATTIIDWGETVITHPFFSLISGLTKAASRYHLKETDNTFIQLQNACLESWVTGTTQTTLLETMRLAKKLWPIYSALGYYRLMISSNMNSASDTAAYFNTGRNAGRYAGYFIEFIKTSENLAPSDTSRIDLADAARPIL